MKPHEKENNIRLLNRMQNFCENEVECRRVLILNYFDEKFQSKDCKKKCDNCAKNQKIKYKDFSKEIKTILEFMNFLSAFDLRFTQKQLVSFLRGINDKSEKIKNINDQGLLGYKGNLKACDTGSLSRLVRLLIVQGMLTENLVPMRTGKGGERIFSVVEPATKGMNFLGDMQRKKVKADELEKLKIAVVDFSSNNIIEENVNNIGSINNIENNEFENLVESAVAESEGYSKDKKKNNKVNKIKKNNKAKKVEKDLNSDISEVVLQWL